MSTHKLTLILASLAFVLALAVTALAASAAETQTDLAWCSGQQTGAQGQPGYASNC